MEPQNQNTENSNSIMGLLFLFFLPLIIAAWIGSCALVVMAWHLLRMQF